MPRFQHHGCISATYAPSQRLTKVRTILNNVARMVGRRVGSPTPSWSCASRGTNRCSPSRPPAASQAHRPALERAPDRQPVARTASGTTRKMPPRQPRCKLFDYGSTLLFSTSFAVQWASPVLAPREHELREMHELARSLSFPRVRRRHDSGSANPPALEHYLAHPESAHSQLVWISLSSKLFYDMRNNSDEVSTSI